MEIIEGEIGYGCRCHLSIVGGDFWLLECEIDAKMLVIGGWWVKVVGRMLGWLVA